MSPGDAGNVGGTCVAVTNGDGWRRGVSTHCPAGRRTAPTAEDHRPRWVMCRGGMPPAQPLPLSLEAPQDEHSLLGFYSLRPI